MGSPSGPSQQSTAGARPRSGPGLAANARGPRPWTPLEWGLSPGGWPAQPLPSQGRDHAPTPRGAARGHGAGDAAPSLARTPGPPRTLHAAAAGLQHAGIHARPRLRRELVARQVGVVGRADEVVAERPRHVLVHGVVARVEDVPGRAPRVVREACGGSVRGGSARGPAPLRAPRGTRGAPSRPPRRSGTEATPPHRRCPAPPSACSPGRARTAR